MIIVQIGGYEHMINLLFSILMIVVFGKLLILAIKMTWGILKVVVNLIFLPIIIIALMLAGFVYAAFIILIIVGLISLLVSIL